jgi:hypothetical protein
MGVTARSPRAGVGDGPSCFGFEIRSRTGFQFLRRGGGRDLLEVEVTDEPIAAPESTLLYEWTLRDPSADVTARLYGADGIYQFWTSDAGWFRIDPKARRIELSHHEDAIRREQRLWGVPASLCVKDRGDFVLHGAAVEVDGGAILLAAPGRFGKTTLALAFHQQGHRILTEDTACCSLEPAPALLPGPTSVRLRPDMFAGRAPDGMTVVDVRPDRVHLVLDADRQGGGRPVPIRAIVFLREAEEDIRLERVKSGEALPDLWTLTFRFQHEAERRRAFSQLAQLAARVPVWNLFRPLNVDDLQAVVRSLADGCR